MLYRLLSNPSPHPVSDPLGLGWGTESCTSHTFPVDADAAPGGPASGSTASNTARPAGQLALPWLSHCRDHAHGHVVFIHLLLRSSLLRSKTATSPAKGTGANRPTVSSQSAPALKRDSTMPFTCLLMHGKPPHCPQQVTSDIFLRTRQWK